MADVREVTTADFKTEVLDAEGPVVVDFWAPWCGPCKMVGPEIERLAEEMGDRVRFVKVNVDDNGELARQYGVMSIPTITKFEDGGPVSQIVGAQGADTIARTFGLS